MNEKFTKLKIQDRETVPSKIVDAIVDLIINKELQPGDKLPSENEWMEIFGVGRNSIREAIKMLSSLGIVEIRKGQGTFVAKRVSSNMFNPLLFAMVLDQPLSIHLVELRIMIEKGVGELAIDKASEDEIDALDAINEKLIADGGSVPLKDIDLEFHSRLLKIAGNPLVEKIGDMVYRLFESAIEKSVAESPDTAYQNHKKMLKALRARDKEAMGSAVSGSLSIWEKSIPNKEKK